MKYLGSYPGAYRFRFIFMAVFLLVMIGMFLSYVDGLAKNTERISIQQTVRVINSVLVVKFAELSVSGQLNRLNELVAANPFELMRELKVLPSDYRGQIDDKRHIGDPEFGWFYMKNSQRVIYKARFEQNTAYFMLDLSFDDANNSGRFELAKDNFKRLYLKPIAPQQ